MARTHARTKTGIYQQDDDWRALPMAAQWLYNQLLAQIGMKQCGVVQLQVEKWAEGSADTSVEDVQKALGVLEERRYVIIDRSSWEVLVRSFIRNDGVHKHPNTLKAAIRTAQVEVESRVLKVAIAVELRRLGVDRAASELDPDPTPEGTGTHRDAIEMASGTRPDGNSAASEVPAEESNRLDLPRSEPDANAMPSGSFGGRGEGGSSSSSVENNSTPKKNTRASRKIDTSGFADFWAVYPLKVARLKAEQCYANALKKGADPDALLVGARRYAALTHRTEERFIAHPTTWLNQGRWLDEPASAGKAASGGYQSWHSPTDEADYELPMYPPEEPS